MHYPLYLNPMILIAVAQVIASILLDLRSAFSAAHFPSQSRSFSIYFFHETLEFTKFLPASFYAINIRFLKHLDWRHASNFVTAVVQLMSRS